MRMWSCALALCLFAVASADAVEPAVPDAAAKDLAKTLVDRWLSAQNRGAFADYSALYMPRFTGVRRSGSRVVRLDRKGWLQDRERMFQRPMKVELAELQLSPVSGGVVAQFQQTFAQGTYKDSGQKLMMLARDSDGTLRIAREELLGSTVDATQVSVGAPYLHLIAEGVVLHSGAPSSWAKGALQLLSVGPPVRVRSAVDESKLPERYRAFLGKPLQLVGASGPVCTAKVKGLALLHRVEAYPESAAVWEGTESGEDGRKRRRSDATIASEAWVMGENKHLLLAELELSGTTCGKLGEGSGPTWARAATEPTLKVLKAQVADAAWTKAAIAGARKLPEYAKLQKEFLETKSDSHKSHWEDAYNEPKEVRVMVRDDGSRILSVLLSARGGCADFGGTLWAVWDVQGGPGSSATWKLLFSSLQSTGVPSSATDIDGDGREELLTPNGILRRQGDRLRELDELEIPSFICPC